MLRVSASPHIRDDLTTRGVMMRVAIALIPVIIASGVIYGWRAPLLFLISAVACVVFEGLARIIMKRDQTIGDFSAVVTGLLLAASLPAECPIWILLIGDFFAIVFTKQMFGGLGDNFANPAVTGRVILSVSFAGHLAKYSVLAPAASGGVDLISQATPLALAKSGAVADLPTTLDLFLGRHAGSIGETCALALIIGGVYLILAGIIDIWAPVTFIGTTILFVTLTGQDPLVHLFSGALMLAAFFMVTDYVTTPTTILGKIIFGIGAGLLTGLLRVYSSMPEGVSFAILLMNILVPHIERWTAPKTVGGKQHAKA
ncbi:MAG: RnfABCDGE type electron transport complex subunit D [Saccharofermentanales bacterium]|jgi:electron transport complex protein RnfD